jgi:hypothetical protein
LKDVEKILLSQNYSKQQIQNAINALRPIDQSIAALRGESASRPAAAAPGAAPNFGAPTASAPTAGALAAGGMMPPPPLTPVQSPRPLSAGGAAPTSLPPLAGSPGSLPGAPAGAVVSATGANAAAGGVQTGAFNPSLDGTRLQAAAAQSPLGAADVPAPPKTETGEDLYRQGLEAMTQGNRDRALELFRKAWAYEGELEPAMRSQLKDKLAALQASDLKVAGAQQGAAGGLDAASQEMNLNRSRLMS